MSVAIETQPLTDRETETDSVAVVLPSNVRLKISPDDFWTLCASNRDLRLERNGQGELIAMSPAGSRAGWLEGKILARLVVWAEADESGLAFSPNAGFTFPNGAVRAPDASWIKLERWKLLDEKQQSVFAPIVPDFVIEICSPSDSRQETRDKMVEYIEQGVRLGWLIDPRKAEYEVEIYRPGRPVEMLSKPVIVSGEEILPRFILELGKILAKA